MDQKKLKLVVCRCTLNTEGQSVTFVYVDSTQGWINTMDSTSNVEDHLLYQQQVEQLITTSCGDYKIHTFTGPGTFAVSCRYRYMCTNTVDYLVVAGGGGGGVDTRRWWWRWWWF